MLFEMWVHSFFDNVVVGALDIGLEIVNGAVAESALTIYSTDIPFSGECLLEIQKRDWT